MITKQRAAKEWEIHEPSKKNYLNSLLQCSMEFMSIGSDSKTSLRLK